MKAYHPPALAAGDRLVVFKTTAAAVRAFAINTLRGKLTIGTTGQTHGHSAAVNSFSVSATPAAASFGSGYPTGPYPNPFTATNQVELFTSDGPRRVFYDASGNPVTAGNFLFSTNDGTVRNKPDITAADGVSTTLPSTSGLNPFYGTSAAAPHAGAIAALLKSANPSLTSAQIRTILTTTALDIESAGYDNISGFGIVQAFQAMQAVNPTPLSNISLVTSTVTEGAAGTNNNGFIEPGENGKIIVQLSNPSTVSATAVSATLTTSTAGVTITQGSASYGTIAASGNSSNTATPYTFTVSNSAACGTAITFSLSVTFGGGGPSPRGFVINVNLGYQPGLNINSTLGSVPPTASGFTSATGIQTGRLNRNTPVSSCGTQKTTPILAAATGARTYDSYTFTNANTADQCVTVTMTAANGTNMYLTAYNSLGYISATPNINFLADQGSSTSVQTFGFTDTAGKSFTMVVHEVNPGGAVGSPYNLSVSLSTCSPVVPLPLTWLSFTATEINKQALLQWKVANEINVSRYEIEYSVDGINFVKLYTLPATQDFALEKTYQQVHPFPAAGVNYYRVKQIDIDGHYTYSRTAIVKIDKINAVTVIPNPASSVVNIQSGSIMNRIQLFSAVGQLLVNVAPASTNYDLPVSQLPAGQYFLRIETDKEIINQKIIRQ